jgi:hypothetical protein
MGIQFDSTVNLGQLITFLGFIIGGVSFVVAVRLKIEILHDRMSDVETELKKMTNVMIELGRQDERLNAMDHRLDDLQRGRGFILDGLPTAIRSPG